MSARRATHERGKKGRISERKRWFRLQFQPNTWPGEVGCCVVLMQPVSVAGFFHITYRNGS